MTVFIALLAVVWGWWTYRRGYDHGFYDGLTVRIVDLDVPPPTHETEH